MTRFYPILFSLMAFGALAASAAVIPATPDSLMVQTPDTAGTRQLQEFVVEGVRQYVTDEGAVYMPDKSTRKRASNGYSLLDIMSIPGLDVNRVDGKVSTATGNSVAFFIDYLPAGDSQVRGLRPEDVRRVEVLDYPADPRFQGAAHVINYILVKYEYGGYVQAGAMQGLRTSWGLYNLYAKTVYKSMTYDVLAGATYNNPMHSDYTEVESTYRFPGMDVTRRETSRNIKSVRPAYWVSARLLYEKEGVSIANTFGYTGSRLKNGETGFTDVFSSPLYPSGSSITRASQRSNSADWKGTWSFDLPWELMLVVSPGATYTRSHNDRLFMADGMEISNNVPETAWSADLRAVLFRQFGRHSLSLDLEGKLNNNYMDYIGTNPIHLITRQGDFNARLRGSLRFSGLNISAELGLYSSRFSANHSIDKQTTMDADISANYSFNSKNSLRLTYTLSYTNPSRAARNPNLVFSNMIDAVEGNPALHRFAQHDIGLTYTLLLTNDLWVSLYGRYVHYTDPIVATYMPMLSGDRYMMVASSQNMGRFSALGYGGSVTYRLFNRSLTLTGKISGSDQWRDYYGSRHFSYPVISVNAQYSLKDFTFSAYWKNGSRGLGWTDVSRTKHSYGVGVSYTRSGFEISAHASDMFEKSKKYATSFLSTPYYDKRVTSYGLNGVCTFQVSLSYSFGFGKKVNQWDKVGQASAVESGANL